MNEQQPQPKTFAEKLQYLLSVVLHPTRREYTVTEVAKAISEAGYPISRGYLSALKEGIRPMPSRDCIDAIADFFGVPPGYFFDEKITRYVEREIELLSLFRNAGIRHISLHAFGLSQESLEIIANAIMRFRRLEGLPESIDAPVPKRKKRIGKRHAVERVGASQKAAPSSR